MAKVRHILQVLEMAETVAVGEHAGLLRVLDCQHRQASAGSGHFSYPRFYPLKFQNFTSSERLWDSNFPTHNSTHAIVGSFVGTVADIRANAAKSSGIKKSLILFGIMDVGEHLRTDVGGRGEIRTHGTLAGTPVFKTGALNHSATLPSQTSVTRIPMVDALRPCKRVGLWVSGCGSGGANVAVEPSIYHPTRRRFPKRVP